MGNLYDSEWRSDLLASILADQDFFRKAIDFLEPEMLLESNARFVYTVATDYYRKHGRIPPPETLAYAVDDRLNDPDVPDDDKPSPAELSGMSRIMQKCVMAMLLGDTEKTPYMSDKLKGYLRAVYMGALDPRMSQEDKLKEYSKIYERLRQYDDAEENNSLSLDDALLKMSETLSVKNRIGTGLASLDIPLQGGLAPGEIGNVISASGVGKTNSLINFAVSNAMAGNYSLFITLEVSLQNILSRTIAMMAGIKASTISAGTSADDMAKWKPDERMRFHDLTDKGTPMRAVLEDRIKILEHVSRPATCDTIKTDIEKWKKGLVEKGVPEDSINFVAVDWLEYIDTSTIGGLEKDPRLNTKMDAAIKTLRQIGQGQKVVMWTAQQAGKDSVGKELLSMKDARNSFGTFTYVDLAIGLSVKQKTDDDGAVAVRIADDKTAKMSKVDPDRDLVVSFLKTRNSAVAGSEDSRYVKIYQGPTLRFWESQAEYNNSKRANREIYERRSMEEKAGAGAGSGTEPEKGKGAACGTDRVGAVYGREVDGNGSQADGGSE